MSQIPGVPEGWELVRLGSANIGEWYLDRFGRPVRATAIKVECLPIIRRIEPVCTWRHGVFDDGWLSQDASGTIAWLSVKPCQCDEFRSWQRPEGVDCNWFTICDGGTPLINPPVFRSDLPWTERIQQVGPTIEATLKEVSDAK